MADPVGPEIDNLINIADTLIISDPADLASWDINLSGCLPIAKAHLKHWSLDVCVIHVLGIQLLTCRNSNKLVNTVKMYSIGSVAWSMQAK
jgi:hypothetical protein